MVRLRILGAVGIAWVAAACGSSSGGSLFNTTGGTGGAAGSGGAVGGAGGSGGATGGTAGTGGATGGTSGAAGSQTGGTSGTGATGGGGTDGGIKDGGNDAPVCTPTVAAVEHIVAEIYAAYDDSGSMWENVPGTSNGTKWSETSAAFGTFVSDPLSTNLWVELSFMPPIDQGLNDCLVASYSPPDVAFGQLGAGTAQAIKNALAPINTGGASPWYGAMQAAIPAATAEAQAHPERDVSILFLADWVGATDCNPATTPAGQEAAPTAQLAGQALAGTPSIRTWVLGLSNVSTEVSYFDPIAAAGGTNKALFPQPPNQTNVLASLQVMHYAIDCEFRLPEVKGAPPVAGSFDLRVQSNGTHALSEVSGEAACTSDGWWSVGPRRVHFCKQACDLVLGDSNAKVELQTKCK